MLHDRIAGAPISWGVSEVDDWGFQMPRERVLVEMRALGLTATEFGPDGWLPAEPHARAEMLAEYDLAAVGGFLPVVLHDPGEDPRRAFDEFADACVVAGAEVVVLAAATGVGGYDARPSLGDEGWAHLCAMLDQFDESARDRGLRAVIHPHIGTMVADSDDVDRVLEGSNIALCIDTGHLSAAGVDPVALTKSAASRVGHVHLKDVDGPLAHEVSQGVQPFSDAVRAGLFKPLGAGDVDVAALVGLLEAAGYDGWYVLEQDVMLAGPPSGEGPVEDVRASLDFLVGLS